MDDFGLLVGRHFTSLPSLSDEQLSELQLDSSGRLIIAGRFAEGAASTAGDSGIHVLAVDDQGDYRSLNLDASGNLLIAGSLNVVEEDTHDEDSAHTSGDKGTFVLAVRQDTLASSTSDDGDYAAFKVNSKGELYIHDVDANASLSSIDTSVGNIETDVAAIETELLAQGTTLDAIDASLDAIEVDVAAIETELLDQGTTLDAIETDLAAIEVELLDQGTTLDAIEIAVESIDTSVSALSHAEDSAHTSGDAGTMSLAVRRDADTSLVDTDGDYAPLQVDADGQLKVVIPKGVDATLVTEGDEEFTGSDEAGDGLVTVASTSFVNVVTVAVGAGETLHIYGWDFDMDQNATGRLIVDDNGTPSRFLKVKMNSSAMPGVSEHWSKEGRIEIAGAANRSVILQVAKRGTGGGSANASGSIHARKVS
jgi:hypothetical protein